jgi:hypothetical protein
MKNFNSLTITLFILLLIVGCKTEKSELLIPSQKVAIFFEKNNQGQTGIRIDVNDSTLFVNREPIYIEIYDTLNNAVHMNSGYDQFKSENGIVKAEGKIIYGGVSFRIIDNWYIEKEILLLDRKLEVSGDTLGGFMSSVGFRYEKSVTRDSVMIFAPGMIYGTTGNLTDAAIGGSNAKDFIRIREDRLPAPMFGAYFENGLSLTMLNSKPDARTTREDSWDDAAKVLIDERFHFGSIGADFDDEKPFFGYWFPGTEGEVTYKGRTYPYGQMKKWSRRYHPIKDGFNQTYQVSFNFSKHDVFNDYYSDTWRWAWATLQPGLNYQDIELVRKSVVGMLANNIESHNGITGIRNFIPAPKGINEPVSNKTVMGFTGKTLETASFLLAEARDKNNPDSERYRELGESVIRTFLKLDLSPPAGEGFTFAGKPEVARNLNKIPEPIVYLRSFGDGLKELLKATKREKQEGLEHEDWIVWARTFADWLLPQQSEAGGFPRTWRKGTGEVFDPFPESSYTVITYLVLLTEITGEEKYVEAAAKAGEFCWASSQSNGIFIGGTIDNPNVIDKEAGTLSLEAYLALYKYTNDKKWLNRAIMAAKFAETWIYIWDVPMPEDEDNDALPWKKGLTTVGMQLISTGHSLTDQYMAFDVDEFAELYLHTNEVHFYDVAMILLHNTKTMLALPGREFDLKGPGWMQEHWSMAPVRGFGIHRGWLPWVSTSLLNGIIELEELDKDLYEKMIMIK